MYCKVWTMQINFAAMPAAQRTGGISSSVAVFLLIISICCVLSLSSRELRHGDGDNNNTKSMIIVVPSYVPNIALICVMLTGILATVIFFCKKGELTIINDGCQLTTRHDLHRKYSLYSMAIFSIGICTIDVNYLIVEFCCRSNWLDCPPDNSEYFLANVILTIFHIIAMVFCICEVVVCWMVKNKNFNPSQWAWHLVAVAQAANITMWFHTLLKESYHRTEQQDDSLSAYFSFCNYTTFNNESDPFLCSETSSVARWFLMSAPVLFPVTIEYNLLVSETLLDRSIGAQSHYISEHAGEGDSNQQNEMDMLSENAYEPNDQTPLLGLSEHSNRETNSIGSWTFNSIAVLINLVHFVLSLLVFLGCKKWDHQAQYFNDACTVYKSFYYLFLTICCVVGMVSSRRLKRQQHSHISFLEYLLLFSTSGVIFQSTKKIVAFSVNSDVWVKSLPAYYTTELLDVIQVTLQIVFYYYVKDVKLQSTNTSNAGNANIPRVKNIIFVICMANFVEWTLNSFIYPHMTACITPNKDYVIESWPVFDNVMIPMYIFFRFNSMLLFWSIYTDLSRPGEHHQGGSALTPWQRQTARPHRWLRDTLMSSHSAGWPSSRLRSRPGHHLLQLWFHSRPQHWHAESRHEAWGCHGRRFTSVLRPHRPHAMDRYGLMLLVSHVDGMSVCL